MSQIDLSKRVAQFVQLRDHIRSLKDKHKTELKPFDEMLEELGSTLLDHLNSINGDSVRTDAGTVYKTQKKSATLADKSAFWTHVVTFGNWDLLDYKANVTAVEDFIASNNEPPPGVNFSSVFTVGVRRA